MDINTTLQFVFADVLPRPWLVQARLSLVFAQPKLIGLWLALQPGAQTPLSFAIIRGP